MTGRIRTGQHDCSICLGDTFLAIETNCGHAYCGECFFTFYTTANTGEYLFHERTTFDTRNTQLGTQLSLLLQVGYAQLVERSLSTPETRGSNPVIGQFYFLSNVLRIIGKFLTFRSDSQPYSIFEAD